MKEQILTRASEYFSAKIGEYGATVRGLDWNSTEAQTIRFDQITRIIRPAPAGPAGPAFTLCDYGCGMGDLIDYLQARYPAFGYHGTDINGTMVELARQKHPAFSFSQGADIPGRFDYIVSSGIFNVRQEIPDEEWLTYILETITLFYEHAEQGFAFNCLTSYSDEDHKKGYLYYADPLVLFDYCKRHFSRNVALLHDYEIYDFTILVRK